MMCEEIKISKSISRFDCFRRCRNAVSQLPTNVGRGSSDVVSRMSAPFGRMGMNDTLLGLIIPFVAPAIGIFMMRQFITSVPDELIQAARADGAGEFRIFWQIVVPLVWPGIATLSIITYVNSWNSFLWPLIILRDDLNYTIPLGMTEVFALSVGQEPQYGQAMAFATLTTIPIIIIFSFVQKYYIAGLSAGAVKG